VHGVAECDPARACTQKHVDPMHQRPVHNGKNVEHRPLAPDVVLRPHELLRRPGASHTLQLLLLLQHFWRQQLSVMQKLGECVFHTMEYECILCYSIILAIIPKIIKVGENLTKL